MERRPGERTRRKASHGMGTFVDLDRVTSVGFRAEGV
jgi:hypothetical protein